MSVKLNIGDTLGLGKTGELSSECTKTGEAEINVEYKSTDTSIIDLYDGKIEAKQMGSADIQVKATAYFPDYNYTEIKYDTVSVNVTDESEKVLIADKTNTGYSIVYNEENGSVPDYVNYFKNTLSSATGAELSLKKDTDPASEKEILITKDGNIRNLGIDTSELRNDGYIIKKDGDKIVIVAKDDDGADRGVRYVLKNYINNEAFSVPENLDIVAGKGAHVKSLTIAGNDIKDYVIVKPGESEDYNSDMYYNAARELKIYIQKATGVSLNIVPISEIDKYDKVINLSFDPTGDLATKTGGDLGVEGYNIYVEDGNLNIVGGVRTGILYGVYELLERFVGWNFIDKYIETVNEAKHIDIPEGTSLTENSFMEYRSVSSRAFQENEIGAKYAAKRRMNGIETNNSIQSSSIGNGLGTTWYHAHSFEYQLGTPANRQPCLSDEKNVTKCIESIRWLIDDRIAKGAVIGEAGLQQVSIGWNDNTNYCNCSKCRPVSNEYGQAELLMRFVNKVADVILEEYPGIEIFTIAYDKARTPSVTKPRDGVIVMYCWAGCDNHNYDENCECGKNTTKLKTNNLMERERFKKWSDMSYKTYTWYYATNFHWYFAPVPNYFKIRDDFNYFARNGIDGIYAESRSGDNQSSFEALRDYMMAEVIWNPYMTEDEYIEIMKNYLKNYFGGGWKEIYDYLTMMDQAGNELDCWITNYNQPQDMLSFDYYAANADAMRKLFDAAESKAETSEQQERIRLARCHMEFLSLSSTYNAQYVNGNEAEKTEYKAIYESLYSYVKDNEVVIGMINQLPETNDIKDNPMKMWYNISVNY